MSVHPASQPVPAFRFPGVIARADGTPTYNFAVVVDDLDMRITHVIRGDDHLNNTPRQINMFRALGAEPPQYAHIPMILGADGKKLSKRHGALDVMFYREEGYLPQALLNYLVRLGWSYGDQEIFSREEMIELFDIEAVNPSASAFNPEKLIWLNQHYLKECSYRQCAADLQWQVQRQQIDLTQGPDLERVFDVQKGRTKSLKDIAQQSRIFYDDFDSYDHKAVSKHFKPYAADVLRGMLVALEKVTDWSQNNLHEIVKEVTESHGLKMGKVAQPLRVALTGGMVSPSIDLTLMLVGKSRSLMRIQRAIEMIESKSSDR